MTSPTRRMALACAAALCCQIASAQPGTPGAAATPAAPAAPAGAFPSKPIRMVVGFAAGGSTDKLARLMAQAMGDELSQSVVVDNRPGAAGNVASEMVATAAPDGYTVFMTTLSSQAINPHLYNNLRFDPLTSFAPITLVAKYPLLLMVGPAAPVDNLAGFFDYAKKQSGKLHFSSAGNGSPGHLAGEILKHDLGIQAQHVPYKGGNPAMMAVMSGEVQFALETIPSAIGFVRGGKLKGIAVTSDKRSGAAPTLPTLKEGGLKNFSVTSWAGLVAPAQTPRPVLDRLAAAARTALSKPAVRDALKSDGAEAGGGTPAEFAQYMAGEYKAWGDVVKTSNTRLE